MVAESPVIDDPEVEGSLTIIDDQCYKDPPVIPAIERLFQSSCPEAKANQKRGEHDEEDVDANIGTATAGRVRWRLMFHRGVDLGNGEH